MNCLRIIFIFLAALVMFSPSALAMDEGFQRTISVNGQGKASSPPDMATIETGIVTKGVTAIEALSENNIIMNQIMDVLEEQKIASKYIQTSFLNVTPEYKRDDRGRMEDIIIGYSVTNQVRVQVHDLTILGQVLDALVRAGSNRISGISFGIDDPVEILNQARKRAIADARSRAELYSQSAGVQMGKVLSIDEQSAQLPGPQGVVSRFAMEEITSVPVASGEQEVNVTIRMVFALENSE